jgi:hypothetical protein
MPLGKDSHATWLVQLDRGETSFTALLCPADDLWPGAYDAVMRVNRLERTPRLLPDDLVTYVQDTGMIVQLLSFDPPWAPNDFDIAGRLDRNLGYPYFEFHDTFEAGETMWGAVDPAMVPASHPGGDFAAFYVIEAGSADQGLSDRTEGLEIMPVKEWCINYNMTPIWSNSQEGEYDVVVDFGSTLATAPDDWNSDGILNAGLDFIDRATNIGAYVVNDPSQPGIFATNSWSYGPSSNSPSDPLRTDVSDYFDTPESSVSETMDSVPLRGVGHYPIETGSFPLILIVHGNHYPFHPSETGYLYLTELLARQGMIAMSIDENFLNGNVTGEMDARAIVLLRHLQRWREWNNTPGHIFYNKVDLNKIGLAGHSRGGEAITVANLFNSTLHNAADSLHDFNFNLKALFALAPVDGQIETDYSGTPIVINQVDYFIMHGSHDGDVFAFSGQKTYDRAFPDAATAGGSKGLVFVRGANHNFWNTEWDHTDDAEEITGLPKLGQEAQRKIGKVYVSGFFQWVLLDKKAYGALMTGDLRFGGIPTGIKLVHQYSDRERIDLNHYEEDHEYSTGSYIGVTNAASGLSPLQDQEITGGFNFCTGVTSPYYIYNQTSGLVVGWNAPTATYDVNLPGTIGALVATHPYFSFRIGQVYESSANLNPVTDNKDLTVTLKLGTTNTHMLKVSNFDDLPYPLKTVIYIEDPCYQIYDITKSVMKTVRIPLQSFVVNRSDWDLTNISKIKLQFNKSASGLVVIDDFQLTK